MSKSIVLVRNAGEQFPEQYLNTVKAAYPKGWLSLAYADEGSLQVQREDNNSEGLSVEDILQMSEAIKDKRMVLALGDPTHPDNILPFFLLPETDDKKDLLIAYLIGEWPRFNIEGSQLSAAFYAANKYLTPKVNAMFNGMHGVDTLSIKSLMGALQHPITETDFSLFTGNDQLILFGANDELLLLSPSKEVDRFPWGWTTNALTYTEGLITKEAPETPKDRIARIMGKTPNPSNPEGFKITSEKSEDGTEIAVAEEVPITPAEDTEKTATPVVIKGSSATPAATPTTKTVKSVKKVVLTNDGPAVLKPLKNDQENGNPNSITSETDNNSNKSETDIIETKEAKEIKEIKEISPNTTPSENSNVSNTNTNKKPKYLPTRAELDLALKYDFEYDEVKQAFFLSKAIKGRKAKRSKYEGFLGVCPNNYSSRPGVRPPRSGLLTKVKTFTEAATVLSQRASMKDTVAHNIPTPPSANTPVVLNKTPPTVEETKKIDEIKKEREIGILSQDKWEALKRMYSSGMITKQVDQSSHEFALNPDKWFEKEARVPGFCQKMGIGLQDTLTWTRSWMTTIGTFDPLALALYCCDLRNLLLTRAESEEVRKALEPNFQDKQRIAKIGGKK